MFRYINNQRLSSIIENYLIELVESREDYIPQLTPILDVLLNEERIDNNGQTLLDIWEDNTSF